MFRVTETFMDIVRAAAYYLPRILLFNISNFALWPRSFSLFITYLLSYNYYSDLWHSTRSLDRVRSERAPSFSFQSWESSWPGIRSAPRMDLGHSAGSDLLNRPRAGTTHTPAARAPKRKKKFFQPANRPGRVSGHKPASQPVISVRLDGCNWIFQVCSIGLAMAARDR